MVILKSTRRELTINAQGFVIIKLLPRDQGEHEMSGGNFDLWSASL